MAPLGNPSLLLAACFAALTLTQCGVPSPPRCERIPRASRVAPAVLISEARAAWNVFARTDSVADRERYNLVTARLADHLRCGPGSYQTRAAAMGTVFSDRDLKEARIDLSQLDSLLPASSVDVDAVGPRFLDPGLGVPMVGWISEPGNGSRRYEFAPPVGVPLNLTLWLDFDQKIPTWRLAYPGRVETATLSGRAEPLAADWSAANAFYWRMSNLDDLDILKLILPSRFIDDTDLYLASPYDPSKIPVMFVHGLNSSPGTYKKMFNILNSHEWFRENYQVWSFSYQTGTSWVYNAALFREKLRAAGELAAAKGGLETWNDMVVVSHSMGGVISHASLVEPGIRFYDNYIDGPPEELEASPETRQAIERLLLYEPLEAPDRVIFLATPHRGAPLATRWLPNLFSNLIRLPKRLTFELLDITLTEIGNTLSGSGEKPIQTSIGTLSPMFGGFEAINSSPWRDGLERHSIIGQWWFGAGVNRSDGVVPYWSSHIEQVASERVVESFHNVTENEAAIQEVARILKLHLLKHDPLED